MTVAADHPKLTASAVSKRFGGLVAVSDFSIEVNVGDLIGLIGPNGAGKTTAFNLITGVYAPTSGEIHLGSRRIDGLNPVAINHAGIARTFQNIRLFKSLTVLDNVVAGFNRSAEHGLIGTVLRTPHFFRERRDAIGRGMELVGHLPLAQHAELTATALPCGDERRLGSARALRPG